VPGAIDVRLGSPWALAWDTSAADGPRVWHVPGSPSDATACRTPSGNLVVFDGYLFDRHMRASGPLASEAAQIASDPGVRPEALVRELAGAFAVVIWDAARRRLVIGRDAMGLTPCFYSWNGSTLLVSTSLDAILARRGGAAAFDRAVVAEYLQDRMRSHQIHETFYQGMRRLPPAHTLRVERGIVELSRYWDPVPPGFAWTTRDELSRFDHLLEQAVDRCLAAGADSIALSGGFDSVSVAALAASRPGGRRPLHAVSLRFVETVCDEGPTQVEVARALGMPQLLLTLDEALGGESLVDGALRLSSVSPSPVLSPWQSVYSGLFRSATRLGLRRVLLGTGGDDLLNVHGTYGADRLAALDLGALWRFCRACQRSSALPAGRVMRGVLWDHALAPELTRLGRDVLGRVSPSALDWVRRRRRRKATAGWAVPTDPEIASLLEHRRQSVAPVDLGPGERAYVANVRRLVQAPLLLVERDQSHAWSSHLGVTFLYPYFDRDLVDLSLRIHPEELIAGGRHKAPLRRLVARRLPTVAMRARKVEFSQTLHDALRPAGRTVWRNLGGPVMLREFGLVDARRLETFLGDYFDGRHADWLGAWLAISTESWLRARSGLSFTSVDQEAAA